MYINSVQLDKIKVSKDHAWNITCKCHFSYLIGFREESVHTYSISVMICLTDNTTNVYLANCGYWWMHLHFIQYVYKLIHPKTFAIWRLPLRKPIKLNEPYNGTLTKNMLKFMWKTLRNFAINSEEFENKHICAYFLKAYIILLDGHYTCVCSKVTECWWQFQFYFQVTNLSTLNQSVDNFIQTCIISTLSLKSNYIILYYLLGHGCKLQCWSSAFTPLQSAPPCWGGGLVHVRALLWLPPPHVTVHGVQSSQSSQSPSTMYDNKYTIRK